MQVTSKCCLFSRELLHLFLDDRVGIEENAAQLEELWSALTITFESFGLQLEATDDPGLLKIAE